MIIDTIAGAIFNRARYYRDDMPKRFAEDVKIILETERAVSKSKCAVSWCNNEACDGKEYCKIHQLNTNWEA